MDTKLKNSRRIRTILAVVVILVITIGNLLFFPKIGRSAEKRYEELKQEQGVDEGYISELIRGSYVLYYEATLPTRDYPAYVGSIMESLNSSFQEYVNTLDYCIAIGDDTSKNTVQEVEILLEEEADPELAAELQEWYQCYFVLNYDENGELSVENVWSQDGKADEIVKLILQNARTYDFENIVEEGIGEEWEGDPFPRSCRIVFAAPESSSMLMADSWMDEYWGRLYTYAQCGSGVLYVGSLAVLVVIALLLTSNTIWRNTIDFKRRGPWYLAEAAVIGVIGIIAMYDGFVGTNSQYVSLLGVQNFMQVMKTGNVEQVVTILEMMFMLVLIYGGWYLCLLFIRPLFSLGPKEYVRQYSLIWLIGAKCFDRCRRYWNKTRDEISHIDFSNKTIKTMRKIVIINFLILAVLSCFWFFGIFALIAYSIGLFFLMKKQYDRIEGDYQSLMQATSRIAQGDLKYEDEKDWGVFEPFKEELAKIRSGFSKAVEEEVKSQRMKAELITNVSHDLKTPLTAITTYVELLKDEDITEEQRKSYIEILEKKSLRLKVLVEDLFEVSKATSNTIKLDLMEVDVVNLLKQVCVEHENRFEAMGLSVKWKLPEEKVTLMLDNQKTWRIFENLFLNIEKYAMPGSRVFVEVTSAEGVEIVIKNMSAQELSVTGEEITERFVRGDASRTTEGSGLGLAIAKSFVEAQKGTFEVTVDGDLFKVRICW